MSSRYLPNLHWVRLAVCPAVVFIATAMDRGYQTDFWHHLARGRAIAETGRAAADVESFSFTVAGQGVRDANWLTQLAYFRLFELGGMPLVQTINSLILAAAAAVLVWICRKRGAGTGVAMLAGLFAFAGAWQTLLVRPQSVSILLFVLTYAILLGAESRRRLLLLVPPTLALWANVHGGFPIGLVLIAAFIVATAVERLSAPLRRRPPVTGGAGGEGGIAVPTAPVNAGLSAGERESPAQLFARAFGMPVPGDRHAALAVRAGAGMLPALVACFIASALATLINPYGVGIYDYVLSLSSLAAGRQVEEWLPPSMGLWVGRAWAASVFGLIALLALAPRRPRVRDVFVALCFLPLASASVRMVPWWLIAVAPVLATTLARNLAVLRAARRDAGSEMGREAGYGFVPVHRASALAPAAMLALIGASVMLSIPSLERHNPVLGTLRPAARPEADLQAVLDATKAKDANIATDATRARSRVFARLEWGEYLTWAAHPGSTVFMDGRIEIYPDDVWRQYHAVTAARDDWQAILDARRVDVLLLDATFHERLIACVEASDRWRPLARAGPARLYARRGEADDATTTTVADLRDSDD